VTRGRRLIDRWNEFWFAPQSPTSLGVCRLLFYAGLLWLNWPPRMHAWVGVPAIYRKPLWTFEFFHMPFLQPRIVVGMEVVWTIAMLCAAVGLFTRVATAVAFVFGFYLLALGNNFGKIGHGDQAMVLSMLILALSRCGDGWSIDAWIRRRRRRDKPPVQPSGEYRWPVRMIWLLLSVVFCAAGASKLVRSGFAWITSDHLALTLIQAHYFNAKPPTQWGLAIARHPWLCHVLAAGAIALELAFPLALVSRVLRIPIVAGTFLMQVCIGLTLGIWFLPFLMLYLFWVPWDHAGTLLRSSTTRTHGTKHLVAQAATTME
jgi:hypothetical protein